MNNVTAIALTLGLFLSACVRKQNLPPAAGPGVTVVDIDTVLIPVTAPRRSCGGELINTPALVGTTDSARMEQIVVLDQTLQDAGYRWAGPVSGSSTTNAADSRGGIDLSWLGYLLAILVGLLALAGAIWLAVWLLRNPPGRGTPTSSGSGSVIERLRQRWIREFPIYSGGAIAIGSDPATPKSNQEVAAAGNSSEKETPDSGRVDINAAFAAAIGDLTITSFEASASGFIRFNRELRQQAPEVNN